MGARPGAREGVLPPTAPAPPPGDAAASRPGPTEKAVDVELRVGDITCCDLSEGTHFFLCSTAFSASACRAVAAALLSPRCPRFRVLVTSRMLPFSPAGGGLLKVGEFRCAYTWNLGGTAHVYTRPLGAGGGAVAAPELLASFWAKDGVAWLPTVAALPIAVPDLA